MFFVLVFFTGSSLQIRLSEACEAIDHALDPTATSDLSQQGLARLVWIMTRQKPCISIARLRVDSYGVLNARLRRVHERMMASSQEMQTTMAAIKEQPLLLDDWVTALANQLGFQEEWFTQGEPRGRAKAASATPPPNQQRLPDMVAAVVPKAPEGRPALRAPAPAMKAASVVAPSPPATISIPVRTVLGPPPLASPSPAPVPKMIAAAPAVAPSASMPVALPKAGLPQIVPTEVDEAAADEAALEEIMRGDGPEIDGEEMDAEAMVVEPEGPMCCICQLPLAERTDAGQVKPVLALACGHSHHEDCLRTTWRIGNHPEGWCPFKCDVRALAAEMEENLAAGGNASSHGPILVPEPGAAGVVL